MRPNTLSRKRKKSQQLPSPDSAVSPVPGAISPTLPRIPRRATWLHLSVLFLLSLALYAPTLRNDFVTDDKLQILQNPFVKNPQNLGRAFTGDVWSFAHEGREFARFGSNYYRPLQLLVYTAEYAAFGEHPWAWHLVNILLNAAVVSLLYFLLLSFSDASLAFWAAFWFALHPLHTEPVAWIAALPELQCALFLLLAMLFYRRARNAPSSFRPLLFSSLFFLAALFSKETALLFPAILLCYEFLYARPQFPAFKTLVSRLAPPFAVLAFYLFARISALSGFAPYPQPDRTPLSLGQLLLAIPAIFARYIAKFLFPVDMNYFYSFPLTTSFTAWTAAGLLLALLLLAAIIFFFWTGRPLLSFAICWSLLTLAPAFSFNSLGANFFTERYLYIPSLGICVLAAAATLALFRNFQSRPARVLLGAALAAIFVFYVVQIQRRIPVFHDNFSLFSYTVEQSPNASVVQGGLAAAYYDRGDLDHALEHVLLALQINPNYELGHINAAWYFTDKGRYDEAITQLNAAIRIYPNYLPPWINLAKIYTLQGNWRLAREAYEHASKIDPSQTAYFLQLAALAASNEKSQALLSDLQSAADRAPADFSAWVRLGDASGQAGQSQRAADAFQHAAKLQPANVLILVKWGISLQRAGNSAQAVEVLQRALLRQPDDLLTRQFLASALAAANRLADSSAQLRKILEMNATWEHADQVHFALGANLERSGAIPAAAEEYRRALALNPALAPASQRLAALAANQAPSSSAPTP